MMFILKAADFAYFFRRRILSLPDPDERGELKMSDEKKKYKNLATYAVVMALAVVVLIIFAAMADNREQNFETQLNEKESLNVSIQNEIVSLKDENYNLKNSSDKLEEDLKQATEEKDFYNALSDAWQLYGTDKKEEAAKKLEEINVDKLSEEQNEKLKILQDLLADKTNNKND